MTIKMAEAEQFQTYISKIENIVKRVTPFASEKDTTGLYNHIANFRLKTEDFYRENRKLNIGVVGQVKAGKSSFLNALLFNGDEILPKASTPKTATLTKIEHSDKNCIQIEYYSEDEWGVLEDNAAVDLEDEVYHSAKEIVGMARRNGIEPMKYLKKGVERIEFGTHERLMESLNDYVGEDGRYTPIVKAVTLFLTKEEFQGISIVDTPGLNDPIVSRTIRTKEFMEVCDVVFFLSQSSCFLDKSDWTLLSSQLPQKGVKRLVLNASKYDSGIRDVLRVQDEDDIFGEDEGTANNIPKACAIVKGKLKARAKKMVQQFVEDLEMRGGTPELIEVVRQCTEPIPISAMTYNMSRKKESDYTSEEKNLHNALKPYYKDAESELRLLGNFDEVNRIFGTVIKEKERILEEKANGFIPVATQEFVCILRNYKEKAESRANLLANNDKEKLRIQKSAMEAQIGGIRADIASVFAELITKLEIEKQNGIQEIRAASKDYLELQERTGSRTRTSSYTTGILFWKKTHYYDYQEHYSYCIAADAIENLTRYSADAVNHVERVFTEAIQLKELRRKLLTVVMDNFDMGSEKYNASLFRMVVEEAISSVEFPTFSMDISEPMGGITAKFTGEITSTDQKNGLTTALITALDRVHSEMSEKLKTEVSSFRTSLEKMSSKIEESILESIKKEFELLLIQYEDKEKEIETHKKYAALIENELKAMN